MRSSGEMEGKRGIDGEEKMEVWLEGENLLEFQEVKEGFESLF